MPRLSDRQRLLRELIETVDLFFLLEIIDAEEDEEVLETLMLCRMSVESQRYLTRPPKYNLKAQLRAGRFESILSYDDRHFRMEARMSKVCFWRLVDHIKDNPVFSNQSHREQDPVQHQLLVTLFRLGKYGNGAGVGHTASYLSCGDGTAELFTGRCLKAIYDLRNELIQWPKAAERATIAARIAHGNIFGNCVGMIVRDGRGLDGRHQPQDRQG